MPSVIPRTKVNVEAIPVQSSHLFDKWFHLDRNPVVEAQLAEVKVPFTWFEHTNVSEFHEHI